MSIADIFDIVMLLVVVLFAVKGLIRGLAAEVFSLVGVIAGVYVGFAYAPDVSVKIYEFFPGADPRLLSMVSIALIFFAVSIACGLVGKLFAALLSFAALGPLNYFCGFLVGGVKGLVVVVFLVTLLEHIGTFFPMDLQASRAVTLVNGYLPMIQPYIQELLKNSPVHV